MCRPTLNGNILAKTGLVTRNLRWIAALLHTSCEESLRLRINIPGWWNRTCVIFLLGATASMASAQTFTTLAILDGNSLGSLVQGLDGNFYGTNLAGIAGEIFKITPTGAVTTVYAFNSTDGDYPSAGLVLATDGNFYGTTLYGGTSTACSTVGCGTVFKITPSGVLTTLHSFEYTDGANPYALIQGSDGELYGTTSGGGSGGDGSIFKITLGGALTTLHFMGSTGDDGYAPEAGLVEGADGNYYGTTAHGGSFVCTFGCGTIFKMIPDGTVTTLHNFSSTDGSFPDAPLIQAPDGNFYGTTLYGGSGTLCIGDQYFPGCGTVFKVTPSGTLTTLYSFCTQTGCNDGWGAQAGLVQGTDGSFYGATYWGGANSDGGYGSGTVFKITASGALTTLHSFDGLDGGGPYASLIQGTDGDFYGTTANYGTVYSISMGLSPFVKMLPHVGKVGGAVKILGTDLTGATSVNFNGTAALFTVVSATEITATVPAGATTGRIQVATPGGALFSGGQFLVRP
jgi:uncharacterized repeat protein (TIGR03803 family)